MKTRSVLVVVSVLAMIVIGAMVLEGCGGGSGGPLGAVAEAAEKTREEPGGHIVMHSIVTSAGSSKPLAMTGEMVYDDEGRSSGEITTKDPKTGKAVKAEMVSDGSAMYMSSALFGAMPNGDKWMEMEFPAGKGGSGLSSGDATAGLKMLEESGDFEKAGSAQVRGVATTRYRGTLESGMKTEAWIDGEGRLRRMRLEGSPGSRSTVMTMDFFDFGPVPGIKIPDPSEVFNVTELVEGDGASSAGG